MIEVIVTCIAFVAILCAINFLYNLREHRKICFANHNVDYRSLFIETSKNVVIALVFTLFGLSALAFFSGAIITLMKFLNWHKNDRWVDSVCDLSIDLKFEHNVCRFDGKWGNIGSIFEWLSQIGSPSIVLFSISISLFALMLSVMGITTSIVRGTMNKTYVSIIIRQTLVGILYLSPFWLAFLYIPTPFNILAPCLLIIKQKLPSSTDLYELQVLAKQTALILARMGTDEERANVERIKQTFAFGDEAVHDADKDGASAKFLMDTLFHVTEGLSIAAMIGWFVLT